MPTFLHLGRIVATRNIVAKFTQADLLPLINRHIAGDWGEVDVEDWRSNDHAVRDGDRVLSAYTVEDKKLWIITEADRSVTTILFPCEY